MRGLFAPSFIINLTFMFAVANQQNPAFDGVIKALGVTTTYNLEQVIRVATNGTTPVAIFGATNGITGTFTGIKTISKDNVLGNVTLATATANGQQPTTVAVVAKGSAGFVMGSYVAAPVAFVAAGSASIVSSTTGNALVEIYFTIPNTPYNP